MTKREKTLLKIALVVVVAAVYMMLILPRWEETNAKMGEIQSLQMEIDNQTLQLAQIPLIKKQIAENETKLFDLQHAYNDVETQEAITTYFTELAEKQALKVTAFTQTRTNQLLEDQALNLLPMAEVTMTCTGENAGFLALVDELNKREDITVLTLSQTKNKDKTPPREYTLTCLLLMNLE